MKGSEKLRKKLPDYQGKSLFKFIIVAFITILSSIIFQLFLGALVIMLLYNILLSTTTKDKSYAYYTVVILAQIAFAFAFSGLNFPKRGCSINA